jgi:hypothetical protein
MLLEPVQLLDAEDVDALVRQIQAVNVAPTLIILDTLNRCFAGGEENSAKDVGLLIAAAQRLQVEANPERPCTVLIVHHTGKSDLSDARGSSALRGGMDSMVTLARNNGVIQVQSVKQKDDEDFRPIAFKLKRLMLAAEDGTPTALSSCVLEPADAPVYVVAQRLNESELRALRVLMGLEEAKTADWRGAVQQEMGGDELSPHTFEKWRSTLVNEHKFVEQAPGRLSHYRLTEAGKHAIGASVNATDEQPESVSHASPPIGGVWRKGVARGSSFQTRKIRLAAQSTSRTARRIESRLGASHHRGHRSLAKRTVGRNGDRTHRDHQALRVRNCDHVAFSYRSRSARVRRSVGARGCARELWEGKWTCRDRH